MELDLFLPWAEQGWDVNCLRLSLSKEWSKTGFATSCSEIGPARNPALKEARPDVSARITRPLCRKEWPCSSRACETAPDTHNSDVEELSRVKWIGVDSRAELTKIPSRQTLPTQQSLVFYTGRCLS